MNKVDKIESTSSSVSDEDIKRYKRMVLEIMKNFHDFLKKQGIKYSLAFGTLLGAIRHDGYIPWDDDIDIILTGEEFKKLMNVVDKFNNEKYLVVKPLDDNPLGISRMIKIYDKRACMKEFGVTQYDGPFIDVFSTIDITHFKKHKVDSAKFRLYTSLYSFKTGRINSKTHLGRASFVLGVLSHFYSKKQLIKKISKYYNKTGAEWCITSFGSDLPYKKEWFNKYETHKFEQYEFNIVKRYDEVLKAEYGDYMQLPPIEKRNPHHLEQISFEESFLDKTKNK